MSPDDEALMWDILDLGASSSSNKTTHLGDLIPPHSQTHTECQNPPLTSPATETIRDRSAIRRPSMPQDLHSQEMAMLYDRGPDPVGEEPIPEWPFPNRTGSVGFGPAIPDVPDWMILGGYMGEHL